MNENFPPVAFPLMKLLAEHEDTESVIWTYDQPSLFWNIKPENLKPEDKGFKFFVLCSDLFEWGCADSEEITMENLPLLEKAYQLEKEATGIKRGIYATTLFCCMSRKMRPQKPCYKNNPEWLTKLFDEYGPARND